MKETWGFDNGQMISQAYCVECYDAVPERPSHFDSIQQAYVCPRCQAYPHQQVRRPWGQMQVEPLPECFDLSEMD